MSRHPVCVALEPDLLAAATGEASEAVTRRVREHVETCRACDRQFQQYRAIGDVAERLAAMSDAEAEAAGRARLESRLADVRRRLVRYHVFPSPLGHLLIAISEHGVSLVEYLGTATTVAASRLARVPGVEAVEDGHEVERLYRELMDYLGGRRRRLDWPLDLRLARSDFHRAVLRATAAVPFGAVTSYANLAAELGRPSATRAVAQALRWNPVPIVVPCHRIVGSSGELVGYAGRRVGLKQRLLSLEGVALTGAAAHARIARERLYVRAEHDPEYCVPTCGELSSRSLARLTLFASREEAERIGLRPCTACRPDLHPIVA